MMTINRAIEILRAMDGAERIEMTRETKEAIEMAVVFMAYPDTHDLDGTQKERRITFGELLDLIDSERESDDAIELMGHNGEVDITGRVSSAYFAVLEDHVVNGFGAHNNAVQVWLED